jgi:succinoglycan biosynthesis transport protein ExoP
VATVVFAIIAAIFAALAAAGIRRRFRQVDEVRSRVGMPVLAEVPRMRTGVLPADIFWGRDAPEGLEAFQELRSSLLLMFPGTSPVFAVTSCSEGEGKSSVSANLAWALASENLPVIALDCDLRKPTLNRILGVEIEPGVSDYSSGGVQNLVAATQNPHLEVIPAGIADRHPADIVSSRVPKLLASLRNQGVGVVMDCPPLSGAAETLTLAVSSDAVIVVVDARHFNPEQLQQSVARLEASGATVAGVVLNRVRKGTHTPYGTGAYGQRPESKTSKSTNGSKDKNGVLVAKNGTKPLEKWSLRNRSA